MFGGVPGLDIDVPPSEWQFIGDSDCVRQVKYKKGKLAIELQDGSIYTYFDVHVFVYYNLIRSNSKGYFYNKNIRKRYSFEEGDYVD